MAPVFVFAKLYGVSVASIPMSLRASISALMAATLLAKFMVFFSMLLGAELHRSPLGISRTKPGPKLLFVSGRSARSAESGNERSSEQRTRRSGRLVKFRDRKKLIGSDLKDSRESTREGQSPAGRNPQGVR